MRFLPILQGKTAPAPSSWMGSAGVQQFLSHITDSQLDWGLGFDEAIPRHLNVSPKPLECCFSSILRVIVLLEGEPLSQSQISGRLKQVSLKNFPVFRAVHHSFNSDQFPSPCRLKTSPQHDAATTMLHCGDGLLRVMRGVGFAPDIAFPLMVKKLHFCLIWLEYLLPYVWGVSYMPFDEHQYC